MPKVKEEKNDEEEEDPVVKEVLFGVTEFFA